MSWNIAFNKNIIALFVVLNSSILLADNVSWSGHALVVGKPASVKFLSGPHNSKSNDVLIGDWYQVDFEKLDVIRGDLLDSKQISFEMSASHKESIANEEEIYILLDVNGDTPKVLYWGVPRSIACFPSELIKNNNISSAFGIHIERTSELCTNTKWYK
jgi:hypothetical protein